MHSIFGALWDLWKECENSDWATFGTGSAAQGEEHSDLWSKTSESSFASTWDGINYI